MIHSISKEYSISPETAAKCRELEFWEMTAFINLDALKTEELLKQYKNG
jgi:hypothetical protein